jgi:hypothetical protein
MHTVCSTKRLTNRQNRLLDSVYESESASVYAPLFRQQAQVQPVNTAGHNAQIDTHAEHDAPERNSSTEQHTCSQLTLICCSLWLPVHARLQHAASAQTPSESTGCAHNSMIRCM